MSRESDHRRGTDPAAKEDSAGWPADKADLRTELLAARRALPVELRRDADRGLLSALMSVLPRQGTVACHLPFGSEPCASTVPPLPDILRAAGLRVLLPVLLDDLDLDWVEYDGHLSPARFRLLEPVGVRLGVGAVTEVAAVVAPAVAVDRSGARLGRGGGSYDRALGRVPSGVPVIVPLYDGELVDRVPVEPHDREVTMVVTPSRGPVTLAPGSGRTAAP